MCNRYKVSGPNGDNMRSLQKFWYMIKSDVVDMFRELHKT